MPIDKNKPFDPEYYDEDGSMFEDELLIDEEANEDVLDNDVESLDEIEESEEQYDEDGYGGSVEGIYNWDEWN
tara:strand:+ start:344 stop:562 length:219 start_codon:yes stop_codon:yes gene_type:complete